MFCLILAVLLCIEKSASLSADYRRQYKLIRLIPMDEDQLNVLKGFRNNASNYEMDFWTDPYKGGIPVDVMVNVETLQKLNDTFTNHGLQYNVTLEDVEEFIINQKKSSRLKDDSSSNGFSLGQYNSYSDIEDYLDNLQHTYSDIVKVFSIGQSHEKRQLKVIKIGNPRIHNNTENANNSKKSVWIDAGIHAREWIAPSTALYFITQLVTKYNDSQQIRRFVDDLDFYIIPVLNPDGYEYSRSSVNPKIRLWRKNRSPKECIKTDRGEQCCQGVDLNRNFDFHWGEMGASKNPCDDMYAGKKAFSEPESKALKEFLTPISQHFYAFVTLHSYFQVLMYPFGNEKNNYPPDVAELQSVALHAKKAIQSVFGTKYIVGTGPETLYSITGGSDDWAKGKLNIKYTYLFELPPRDEAFGGFLLDESQITPIAKETFEGVKVILNVIIGENNTTEQGAIRFNAECKNNEAQCGYWAFLGVCKIRSGMDKKCPLSCGFCEQIL